MKKQLLFLSGIALSAFMACNPAPTTTTTTAPNADSMRLAQGDSLTKTTTTTTTTTMSIHPIANFEHRTFYNVKTHKIVKLRVDTVNHYYVDASSNSRPDYYYYDPIAHDTFDYQGRVVNNALMLTNGDYTLDESRLSNSGSGMTTTMDTSTHSSGNMEKSGNLKIKQKDGMYKEKTDNSKVKIKTN